MKRIIVISLAIVMMLIPIIGVNCGSDGNGDNDTPPEGYAWHINNEFGHKFAYPEGWIVQPEEVDLQEGMDYSQYIVNTEGVAYIRVDIFSEFDLDDVKAGGDEVSINGRKGYEIEFVTADQFALDLRIRSVAFVVDSKLWVIICAATPSSSWDKYADIFDITINSFVIE